MLMASNLFGQCVSFDMVPDTIDYENTRMYITVPDISLKMSDIIIDDEGFWIYYPIPVETDKPSVLIIDYSVMNTNYMINTKDYDIELWNTFNRNSVGSRCFIKNNLFYRIDRYEDGLEIYYTDVDDNMVNLLNETMRSIYKKNKNNSDVPLDTTKKRIRHGIPNLD